MIILGIRWSVSHYLHFTDDKIKTKLSDLFKVSQISSRVKIQPISCLQVLGFDLIPKFLQQSFTSSGVGIDLYLISWSWSPEPGFLVPALSLGSGSCSTSLSLGYLVSKTETLITASQVRQKNQMKVLCKWKSAFSTNVDDDSYGCSSG